LCANLLIDGVISHVLRALRCVRDVGVAGSNPVTPTIDFRVFSPPPAYGSRPPEGRGSKNGSCFDPKKSTQPSGCPRTVSDERLRAHLSALLVARRAYGPIAFAKDSSPSAVDVGVVIGRGRRNGRWHSHNRKAGARKKASFRLANPVLHRSRYNYRGTLPAYFWHVNQY
jgi:hypothetical protein